MAIPRLYLKKVTREQITQGWQQPTYFDKTKQHYARCRVDGTINWKHTIIFTAEELIERNNVIIKE